VSPYIAAASPRFRQGDILRDVSIVTWAEEVNGELSIDQVDLPYCVVLTQECDLDQDYTNQTVPDRFATSQDKILPYILLCPAFPADQLKAGTHVPGRTMHSIPSADFKRVKQNAVYRYHFLAEDSATQIPDLILDFKRCVTVPRDKAYARFKQNCLAALADLFREHLSSRYAHYLSRVGLPEA